MYIQHLSKMYSLRGLLLRRVAGLSGTLASPMLGKVEDASCCCPRVIMVAEDAEDGR